MLVLLYFLVLRSCATRSATTAVQRSSAAIGCGMLLTFLSVPSKDFGAGCVHDVATPYNSLWLTLARVLPMSMTMTMTLQASEHTAQRQMDSETIQRLENVRDELVGGGGGGEGSYVILPWSPLGARRSSVPSPPSDNLRDHRERFGSSLSFRFYLKECKHSAAAVLHESV